MKIILITFILLVLCIVFYILAPVYEENGTFKMENKMLEINTIDQNTLLNTNAFFINNSYENAINISHQKANYAMHDATLPTKFYWKNASELKDVLKPDDINLKSSLGIPNSSVSENNSKHFDADSENDDVQLTMNNLVKISAYNPQTKRRFERSNAKRYFRARNYGSSIQSKLKNDLKSFSDYLVSDKVKLFASNNFERIRNNRETRTNVKENPVHGTDVTKPSNVGNQSFQMETTSESVINHEPSEIKHSEESSVKTISTEYSRDSTFHNTQDMTNEGKFDSLESSYDSLNPILFSLFGAFHSDSSNTVFSRKQEVSSKIPLYVKRRIQEEILSKTLENPQEDKNLPNVSRITAEAPQGLKPEVQETLISSSNSSPRSVNISKDADEGNERYKNSEVNIKHPKERSIDANGRLYNSSILPLLNTSWYIYMNCSRNSCVWSNSTNARELIDEGWVLHNCSSAGCTEMNPKTESTRKFIGILLLILSLCVLKVVGFVLVFYYCRNLRLKHAKSLRRLYGEEDPYEKSPDEMDVDENREDEVNSGENFESGKRISLRQDPPEDERLLIYEMDDSDGKQKRTRSCFSTVKKNQDAKKIDPHVARNNQRNQRNSKVWSPPNVRLSPLHNETSFIAGDGLLVSSLDDRKESFSERQLSADSQKLSSMQNGGRGIPRWKGFKNNDSSYHQGIIY